MNTYSIIISKIAPRRTQKNEPQINAERHRYFLIASVHQYLSVVSKIKALSRLYILLSVCLFLPGLLGAQEYPQAVGWVNDFAGVISTEHESKITALASEVEQKTSCEITVATVKTSQPQSIDMYAVELFTKWGIGKRGKDNGVLIVAAIDDRQLWIEVGYGLEGALPDGFVGEVYRGILRPNFRNGEYGKGFYETVLVLADRIGKEYNVEITGAQGVPVVPSSAKKPGGPCGAVGSLFFVIFFILIIFSRFWWLLLFPLLGHRGYWSSGTFGGGGGFSGGFGGFGGGSCGGGGAGGGW